MCSLSSSESFMIRQTCRVFSDQLKTANSNQSLVNANDPIYSREFLKSLYDNPREHVGKILEAAGTKVDKDKKPYFDLDDNVGDKRTLLKFLNRVIDMKPKPVRYWTALHHYLCFVYRYCMRIDPDPEQELLCELFLTDMRKLVHHLQGNDRVQLCLRIFSTLREYTIFAQKKHQKISRIESSIESLFYYYEAFLSATKNICRIFPELEKYLLNTYKLGWLDFNTSIFMYYFYETAHVQAMLREFESVREKVSIKAAGIFTVLTELHKLWKSQMIGINSIIAHKFSAKFKNIEDRLMDSHKALLSKNYWIDRSPDEKGDHDLLLFDYQLFALVGDKNLRLPDPTLDEYGNCVCEDCLVIVYETSVLNRQSPLPDGCTRVSCRYCRRLVALEEFQQHINGHMMVEKCEKIKKSGAHSKKSDKKNDKTLPMLPGIYKLPLDLQYLYPGGEGDYNGHPYPNVAAEPSMFENEYEDDVTETKMEFRELIKKTIGPKCEHKMSNSKKVRTVFKVEENGAKESDTRSERSESYRPKAKYNNAACKLEEELRTEFKKAYQDTCDHHKDSSKNCDCTFCESTHTHKTNETRNRLRNRLNQRNEKIGRLTKTRNTLYAATHNNNSEQQQLDQDMKKCESAAKLHQVKESYTPSVEDTTSLLNEIHGILNYIEGNTTVDKMANLAEKKAAKKARQREKKEQEKQRLEDEERKKAEEKERLLLEERLRNEELARQLAEKSKKEAKKDKKKKKAAQNQKEAEVIEEIPAMVTIKRVVENNNKAPTVTITLKGSTPDQDKLLYTLVNGQGNGDDDNKGNNSNNNNNNKKGKKENKQPQNKKTANVDANNGNKNGKKKGGEQQNMIKKELKVTLAVDPTNMETNNKKKDKKADKKKDVTMPMLKLPPGITITKVDGPMSDRNYKTIDNPPYNSNIPVSKSGVIVVDTEKLIKQSTPSASNSAPTATTSNEVNKKNKKKNKKQAKQDEEKKSSKPSMVTLKNPIFQSMQQQQHQHQPQQQQQQQQAAPESDLNDLNGHQQASIFKNENGMVTIRSSRLQQSLSNGAPMPNMLSDLKPVLGPDVSASPYMSSCSFSESSRISPFNAQEILSGLPGIEITKVDKNSTKTDADKNKCQTAEVSIIPSNLGGDKFSFDRDDWHYDSVFTPKDILEDDMDADELELEAFKRFCQQSVPPKRKEKVAHLNVKDIVLKKKHDRTSV